VYKIHLFYASLLLYDRNTSPPSPSFMHDLYRFLAFVTASGSFGETSSSKRSGKQWWYNDVLNIWHVNYRVCYLCISNIVIIYMIGQCCNFQGINSTVEILWNIFRILADYRLPHLVNNVAIHIYTHDYIRMEITVLYLKISRHQLSI
jgi:hypothetical protein